MVWYTYMDSLVLQVQTDFQQISETQFAITIPDADNINHLVVFLTGATAFPEGFGGSGLHVEVISKLACQNNNFSLKCISDGQNQI